MHELRLLALGVVPVFSDCAAAWSRRWRTNGRTTCGKREYATSRPAERSSDWRERMVWTRATVAVTGYHEVAGIMMLRESHLSDDEEVRGTVKIHGCTYGDQLRQTGNPRASAACLHGRLKVAAAVTLTLRYRCGSGGKHEPSALGFTRSSRGETFRTVV